MISQGVRTFIQVVQSQSITGAADALSITKSAVSQQLAHLEASLGARLINRTTRRQSLTPLGEFYYQQCLTAQTIEAQTKAEIDQSVTEPFGPMVVTAPHALAGRLVVPAIQALIDLHPRLAPTLLADDRRLDLIKESVDLAITVGKLESSELMARKLGEFSQFLCASPAFIKAKAPGSSPEGLAAEDLAALDFIGNPWQGAQVRLELEDAELAEKVSLVLKPTRRASTLLVSEALALAGAGLAMLPSYVTAPHFASGQLVRLLPSHAKAKTSIYAVHPYGAMPPLGVRKLIELIRESIKDGAI